MQTPRDPDRLAPSRPHRSGLAMLGPVERVVAVYRYANAWARDKLLSLTLETTKRCNARCDFCDHWREPKVDEPVDFADVVRRFDPLVVIFCGGEPLIRRDIEAVVQRVAAVPGWRYHVLITNGWLLTPELGVRLRRAGLHQINVSLNWPDARQDDERRLKGLFQRIERTVPQLTAQGIEVNLNTMIMRDNLDVVTDIARLALSWGTKVTYTLYSQYCNGNTDHLFSAAELRRLGDIIDELMALKRRHKHITNNDYYLRTCIPYSHGQTIGGCLAGRKMIHVSPQGMVKPCADLGPIAHYTQFDPRTHPATDCDICWMACRGEVQAPVDLARLREVTGW